MQVFLYSAEPLRHAPLLKELASGGITATEIGPDFFNTDPETLLARAPGRTPFLLCACDRTLKHIRLIRLAKSTAPVIVIRAARDPLASAQALQAGADDDIVAPVTSLELLARLNGIARRAAGHASESITLGEARIFFDGRHPEFYGTALPLSRREYAIFHELALNAGRCVSKRALYDAVYGMSEDRPFDKVIDVYICKLRKKLVGASMIDHPYIETVHGRGYRLTEPSTGSQTAAE